MDVEEFVHKEEAQDYECAICLTAHLDGTYKMRCGHFFCKKVKKVPNKECPTCNKLLNFQLFLSKIVVLLLTNFFLMTGNSKHLLKGIDLTFVLKQVMSLHKVEHLSARKIQSHVIIQTTN